MSPRRGACDSGGTGRIRGTGREGNPALAGTRPGAPAWQLGRRSAAEGAARRRRQQADRQVQLDDRHLPGGQGRVPGDGVGAAGRARCCPGDSDRGAWPRCAPGRALRPARRRAAPRDGLGADDAGAGRGRRTLRRATPTSPTWSAPASPTRSRPCASCSRGSSSTSSAATPTTTPATTPPSGMGGAHPDPRLRHLPAAAQRRRDGAARWRSAGTAGG